MAVEGNLVYVIYRTELDFMGVYSTRIGAVNAIIEQIKESSDVYILDPLREQQDRNSLVKNGWRIIGDAQYYIVCHAVKG